MIARLPIRIRLALAFTMMMAALVAAAGYLLYGNVSRSLDRIINQGLEARAADTGRVLQSENARDLTGSGEGITQVLEPSGTVRFATQGLSKKALLTGQELQRAATEVVIVERSNVPEEDNRIRLLGTSARAQGSPVIVVVGAPLDDRDETLANLRGLLFFGGPLALALVSLGGFGVASGALLPVEAMRRRAAGISGDTPGQRLPTSPANDEVRRLGETLNAMLSRIDQTMARERAFIADASHELRTPLAILKGELEVASHPSRTTQELRDAIASVGEEADRLVRLSEDLLVVARADEGRLPVHGGRLHVEAVLVRTADRFAPRAEATGRALTVVSSPGHVVWGDQLRLEQALCNLIENAFQHGEGDIEIAAESSRFGTRLSVRDRGPGLPEDFANVAFERFARADVARGRGGAGLGLAIVRAIAEGHGGAAGIYNVPSEHRQAEGAVAWIDVPDRSTPGASGP